MSKPNVHLLVLIHGMWGQPCHLDELARIIKETKAETDDTELMVLAATTAKNDLSYDGIDNCAERVTEEVS